MFYIPLRVRRVLFSSIPVRFLLPTRTTRIHTREQHAHVCVAGVYTNNRIDTLNKISFTWIYTRIPDEIS